MKILRENINDFDWAKEINPSIDNPYVGMKWIARVNGFWMNKTVYTIIGIDDNNMYLDWKGLSEPNFKYSLETYYNLVSKGDVKEVYDYNTVTENFDWVKDVEPFNLYSFWIISVDNEKEFREVEDYLASNGWSWRHHDQYHRMVWESRFNYFIPENIHNKIFDAYQQTYVSKNHSEHPIHKWSDIREPILNENLDTLMVNEDFDWVGNVPDVDFGSYFNEEDLNEKIFFEDDTVIFQLDWDEFNELTLDNWEDYYYKDVVLHNGTYVDEGDTDYYDDEEVNYLVYNISPEAKDRLKLVLKRAGKLFGLTDDLTGEIDPSLLTDNFTDAVDFLGRNLYRGRYDWDDMTGSYMYIHTKQVNLNRWESLNQHYLDMLEQYGVEIEGDSFREEVTIKMPFPYKSKKTSYEINQHGRGETKEVVETITNLTEMITKGLHFLDANWSDWWFEDFDSSGTMEEFGPIFDKFLDNIEEALDEKEKGG